jgi:HlyD family secretion protein
VVYNVTSSIQATKSASLYPGMTATVTIVSAEHDGVLTVPATALSFAQTAIAQGMVQAPGATAAATGSRPTSSGTSATRSGTGSGTARTEASGTGATSRTTATTTSAGAAGPSYVVTDNEGKLTLVPVTVGLTNGTTTEVSGNLQPGDTVVVGRTGGATTTRTSSSSGNGSSPFVGGGP